MIQCVIIDSYQFFFYFICWMGLFTFLMMIAGSNVNQKDYKQIGNKTVFALNTFRNAIGDIQPPVTSYWEDERMETDPVLSMAMILYSWIIWFTNSIFVFIVLLNFLIALISQSYDAVMANQDVWVYRQRIQISGRCLEISQWNNTTTDCQSRAVVFATSDALTEANQSVLGFVAPIRAFMNGEVSVMKKQLNQQEEDIRKLSAQMQQALDLLNS